MDCKLKQAIFEALTEEYELLIPKYSEPHIFSNKFIKKMNKLIKRQRKTYYPLIKTTGRRIAIAIIVAIVMGSVTAIAYKPVRKAIKGFFIKEFKGYSIVTTIDDNFETDTHKKTIEKEYDITVPKEYSLSKADVNVTSAWACKTYYTEDRQKYISLDQYVKDAFSTNIDNEQSPIIEKTDKYGNKILVKTIDDIIATIIWDNGEYIFDLTATCSEDELMEIYYSAVPTTYYNWGTDSHKKTIEKEYNITVPKEYSLSKADISVTPDWACKSYYTENREKYINFGQYVNSAFSVNIDNEQAQLIEKKDKNGNKILVHNTDDVTVTIIWDDGEYVFKLTGTCSEKELMKIYYSVATTTDDNLETDKHKESIEKEYNITVPKEYSVTKDKFVKTKDFICKNYYTKDNQKYILFSQNTKCSYSINIDNEQAQLIENKDKYGNKILVHNNNDNDTTIIWDNGEYIFELSGTCSEDELMEVYYSLSPK